MLKILKCKFVGSNERNRLVTNIFSLGGVQGVNYILPLLTLPYLVRVLGAEYFGVLAFSTAMINYFMIVTDYGFNLSAARQISIHRNDVQRVNEIFSAVITIKVILMLVSLLLMAILVFNFEKLNQHWEVYFLTFGMVLGQVMFPIWFFQGMEQMSYIAYLNVVSKLIFTACIFIFVHEQADYWLVPLVTSLGYIVSGVCAIYLLKSKFGIVFSLRTIDDLKGQLYEGWHVFFASISISLYTVSATFILGLFASSSAVGYFSAADKIIQAVKGIYAPVSQAIYPFISQKVHQNRRAGLMFIRKVAVIAGSGMFILSLVLFVFADQVVLLVLGQGYQESVLLLRIMAPLPFVITLSNIFGIQTMLNLGYKKAFSQILFLAGVTGLFLSALLVSAYKSIGSSVVMLIVEVMVLLSMALYLKVRLH